MATMTRNEGQAWFATMLLEEIRADKYPSTTHMDMVEQELQGMRRYVSRVSEGPNGPRPGRATR